MSMEPEDDFEEDDEDDTTDLTEILDRNLGNDGSNLEASELNTHVERHELSDTVFVTDHWGRRKGRELKQTEGFNALGLDATQLSDCFNAAFEVFPEIAEHTKQQPEIKAYFQELMSSADFEKVRETTVLDVTYAEIAAASYATGLVAVVEAMKQQQQQQNGNGPPGQRPIDPNKTAQRAAAKAARQAGQQVQSQKDTCDALGIGNEEGGNGKLSKKELKSVHGKIKNSAVLKRICELAGRYRRAAQSAQRNKVQHGIDEVVGIELGGEVSRLLPHELALLDDDDFGDDTMRRLAERECLSREVQASEKIAKGPIIVAVDESGSMDGERIYNAKAFALAMAQIASQQKRWCVLLAWSDSSSRRPLLLKPGQWPLKELVKWLEDMFGGGTNPPIMEMPKRLAEWKAPKGKTDMVLLTDGECYLDENEVQKFCHWKQEEKFRVITLLVGMPDSEGLKTVSDQMYATNQMASDDAGVTAAFSV